MKISVVTITFNAARSLPRTLDSVRQQTGVELEHLIIDGQSADDTLLLAERYREACPYDVVILSEPDKGLYDAMNKGLRLATGNYLVFLNAGDTFYAADTLSTVAKCVVDATQPVGVVYGDTAITDGEGHFLHMRQHRPPEKLNWRPFQQGMLVRHQAFYVRTDTAKNIAYDLCYRHSADVDWCIRVMKEAERQHLLLVNSHAILVNFEEGGDTTQHHQSSLRERFAVMAHHYGLLTTIFMHLWFVLRAVYRRLSKGRES